MAFWTTPKGEKIGFTEFMKRWKEGIKKASLNISPEKQTKSQIKFTWLLLIGFTLGFILSLTRLKTMWWIAIVLFAAVGNTAIQVIALYQKKNALAKFKSFDEILKEKKK